MALPPPDLILANFFQSLTLDAETDSGDYRQLLMTPSTTNRGIFSSLRKRFRLHGSTDKLMVDTIARPKRKLKPDTFKVHTVSLESLGWLESCAMTATARSAMWRRDTLYDIRDRSEEYGTKLEGISAAGTKEMRLLHYRAYNAARKLLSLDEVPMPLLPNELLRCIFLWAACQDVAQAKKLSLVSPDVQDWVDPCVFKYLVYTIGIDHVSSPRMLRAKAHYFVGWSLKMRDYVPVLYIARICVELPVLRSVSAPEKLASRISATDIPSLRRFHVEDWWPDSMPISHNIFLMITHLSLNMRTSEFDALHELEWAPLKHLTVLKFFMLHTHFYSHRRFNLNESHAGSWIDLMNQRFFPSISMSVELIVWVIPDIDMDASLSHYQALLDGSLDRRFVVAFEKGDGLRTHATSENAGAGPYAFVYPPLSRKKSVGLDWLEWLWEEGLEFLENREAVALESHTC